MGTPNLNKGKNAQAENKEGLLGFAVPIIRGGRSRPNGGRSGLSGCDSERPWRARFLTQNSGGDCAAVRLGKNGNTQLEKG